MIRDRLFRVLPYLLVAFPIALFSYSTQPPLQHTGGFGEPTCQECHTGSALNSSGSLVIQLPSGYTPGSAAPVSVTITDTGGGRRRWGFELSARFSDGSQAGSWTAGPNTVIRAGDNGIAYASHDVAVIQPGATFTYTLTWTAPTGSPGVVIFNAVGNAANGDGTSNGDRIYSAQVSVSPATAAPMPAVNAGGVVSAASFLAAPNNQVAEGQLISIFGANLSDRADPYFASQLPLPVTLGSTTVNLAGQPIPLIFVSRTQINAQVPYGVGLTGTLPLVVTVGSNGSTPQSVPLTATSPAIFTRDQNGSGDGAILHADFSLVNSASPAHAGDTVLIYCTGLGAVDANARVVAPVLVTIGGQNARVDFAGLAPGFVGLYQVNAVVPSVTGGADVQIAAGTATSPNGVKIAVQ